MLRYKAFYVGLLRLENDINEAAKDGWKLTTITAPDIDMDIHVVMEREVPDAPPVEP